MVPDKTLVSVDFEITPSTKARVSIFDRGFLFGDSVYEVIRTYAAKPFALDRHYKRLGRSARALGFELPFDRSAIEAHTDELVSRLGMDDCYVRVIVTRGADGVTLHPPEYSTPCTVVIAGELPRWPADYYDKGISLVTVGVRRNLRGALDPMIKSGNYLNNVLASMEARRAGAVEGIMLNADGHVTESSTANLFIVKNGELITPPVEAGILDGVLRHLVLEFAKKEGIPCSQKLFGIDVMHNAEEGFITSTTRDIMPVRLIDGVRLSSPGPVTSRLMETLGRYVRAE